MVNPLEDFHRYGKLIPRGTKAFLCWLCNSTALNLRQTGPQTSQQPSGNLQLLKKKPLCIPWLHNWLLEVPVVAKWNQWLHQKTHCDCFYMWLLLGKYLANVWRQTSIFHARSGFVQHHITLCNSNHLLWLRNTHRRQWAVSWPVWLGLSSLVLTTKFFRVCLITFKECRYT